MPEPRLLGASAQRQGQVAALEIRDLNVFYGASHALQGVNLTLQSGALAVLGRNGMGKTTLCQAIMGLVPAASGSIRFKGQELRGRQSAQIARLGIGYVPQGRRLWRSLTVDEHLRMVSAGHEGAWSIERVYSAFPRLAERRNNGGGQLSGGEQQMLAIARALLLNPQLLIMDEPTEGLAPVIVEHVEDILVQLGDEGIDVLVIEQNVGVATTVAPEVAIMVNGQVNRLIESRQLASDRDLQQRLLGVGRHAHDETPVPETATPGGDDPARGSGVTKIYNSNPKIPTRWSAPAPVHVLEQSARTVSVAPGPATASVVDLGARTQVLSAPGQSVVLVAGTLDTKGRELRYVRDIIRAYGLPVRMVDLSTSGSYSGAEISAQQIAAYHPRGASGVFSGDRGSAIAAMTVAFERWMARQSGVTGIIGAGGSGGTALIAPAMRMLPVGVPKVLVSTVASGDVRRYVGPADIMMVHSVADVQGLNSITRRVLGNAAHALAGMVSAAADSAAQVTSSDVDKPAVGLTMFGVTTPCVQKLTAKLEADYDCLVFHATGIGGQSMEKLVDAGLITGVLDVTTTEVCDMMFGGVFPATEDRFGAFIRTELPYVGACGALDMVNFGAPDTVPSKYSGRNFYEHNPQVTLMRTTADENAAMGRWIGQRLNQMSGPVRFFLPEGGVSALDQPGQPFHDPQADAALFAALEAVVNQTSTRQLIRLPYNVNDTEFAEAMVAAFRQLHVPAGRSKPARRMGL